MTDNELHPPIQARGLVRQFGTARVLDGVDFSAAARSMTAITGASGSGKTTLLNLLGLLDTPDAGTISVGGTVIEAASEADVRHVRAVRLGFVFQDALLDARRTSLENVMLGLRYAGVPRPARSRLAAAALSVAGAESCAGSRGSTLSGGERQRVAIARAIAHRPLAILCDEPTGALDEVNTERVVRLLAELAAEGTAVVIVTHDLEIAARCDRWAEMRLGRLVWRSQVPPEVPA